MAKITRDSTDLDFMSEVDAALRDKGSKWAYRLSFVLVATFVGLLAWVYFTQRNEVTRGEGQITPSLGVQPIQSEQGGIVKEIFVKEGQEVKKGDKLVQMSNIEAVAEYQDLLNKQVEAQLSLKRLDAEILGVDLAYTEEEQIAYPTMVADQVQLYAARKEQLAGGTREIQASLEQKRFAVEEALTRKVQYEQNLLLLKEQAERVRPLVAQGRYSEIDYLNLRQRVISQEGDLNALAETIARTQSEVHEEEARLANRESEWQARNTAERNEYRRQLASIGQKLAAGSHLVRISDLRAPMNGVIRRILLKEENVAQRAQAIMELLPTDDTLEVDARFRPADRGFLEEGMNALVKVDAYDFSIYGGLPAQVTRISPDTIEDSRGQPWYEVRLQTVTSKLEYNGEELEIKPGMTVKVDVISGEKSIFDYLMKPILKSRQVGRARGHAVSGEPAHEEGETPQEHAPDVPPPAPDAAAPAPDEMFPVPGALTPALEGPAPGPTAPVPGPDAPASAPDAPASAPDASASAPDAPASAPDAPVSAPDAPASAPDAPAMPTPAPDAPDSSVPAAPVSVRDAPGAGDNASAQGEINFTPVVADWADEPAADAAPAPVRGESSQGGR